MEEAEAEEEEEEEEERAALAPERALPLLLLMLLPLPPLCELRAVLLPEEERAAAGAGAGAGEEADGRGDARPLCSPLKRESCWLLLPLCASTKEMVALPAPVASCSGMPIGAEAEAEAEAGTAALLPDSAPLSASPGEPAEEVAGAGEQEEAEAGAGAPELLCSALSTSPEAHCCMLADTASA